MPIGGRGPSRIDVNSDPLCTAIVEALNVAGKAGSRIRDLAHFAAVNRGVPVGDSQEVQQALEALSKSGVVGKCPCLMGEQPQWRWFKKSRMPKKFVPPKNLARL